MSEHSAAPVPMTEEQKFSSADHCSAARGK